MAPESGRAGRRRIAVVGSGMAGLTAAHVLQHADSVSLYEADGRLGGHAHTHDVASADGPLQQVDSGPIVHNERADPLLLRLFRDLDVRTQECDTSMSVRCEGCGLEYAGAFRLRSVFAQPRNALRSRFVRMLTEIPRFHREVRRVLDAEPPQDAAVEACRQAITLGQFLAGCRFSSYFVSHFMTPLVAAVWSCSPEAALEYPAQYLFRFLDHQGWLSAGGAPTWRTVNGGAREYVERIAKELDAVHTSTPVRAVRRFADAAEIVTEDGTTHRYDAVVLAAHPDQTLQMLADPTRAEREVLGSFCYSRNPALLHTDARLLPRAPAAQASWNYLMASCETSAHGVCISYHMNRLQRLESPEDYLVTLGGHDRVDGDRVLARMVYERPLYTPESVAAQQRLPELNSAVTAYAGAYHGWGLHEDGCRSGVNAAAALGARW
ncbi:amine oxidase [Streptomyces nanshensis]|nr:amine oxidase [Streptomyces nanshensis]